MGQCVIVRFLEALPSERAGRHIMGEYDSLMGTRAARACSNHPGCVRPLQFSSDSPSIPNSVATE
jgi:hypothetical protein